MYRSFVILFRLRFELGGEGVKLRHLRGVTRIISEIGALVGIDRYVVELHRFRVIRVAVIRVAGVAEGLGPHPFVLEDNAAHCRMIVKEGGAPVGWRSTLGDGTQGTPLHDGGLGDPGIVEDGGGNVKVERHLVHALAVKGSGEPRVIDHQWNPDGLFLDVPLPGLAPLPEEEAVVRSEYYDGVVPHAVTIVAVVVWIVESSEDATDLYINAVDQTVMVLDTVLVFLLGAEAVDPSGSTRRIGRLEKRRQGVELGLRVGLCVGDGVGQIEAVVGWIGLEGGVGGLEADLQAEGRGGWILGGVGRISHELDGKIAHEAGQVAAIGGLAVDGLVEVGALTIVALVEIVGAVEPGEAAAVPVLADESQVVAVGVKTARVGVRPLGGRERSLLDSRDSVARHVLAAENAGAARPADRSGSEGVLEDGSVSCDAVHVGRGDDRIAGEPGRVPAHVIEEEEDDVGLPRGDRS